MDIQKANELIFGFDAKLMYGFMGLLPEDYPESIELGGVTSWYPDIKWFYECCNRGYLAPRGQAETDPSFKQIIPYTVLRNQDRYFTYCRAGAEHRLTGKYSIGIGGHINPGDLTDNLQETPQSAAQRELFEEVNLDDCGHSHRLSLMAAFSFKPTCLLYDSSDDVGKVHFGAVYIIPIDDFLAEGLAMKEEGHDFGWKTVEELKEIENLEGWSRIVLEECLSEKK